LSDRDAGRSIHDDLDRPPIGTHLRDRVHDFQHMRGKGVDKKEKPYESEW
jgi:hypothetical protein